ncbi:MAG: type II toxin-antitoxin system VapC family toxin [Bryocella sp.]
MILCFLDSSAVTKLFLEEQGSAEIRHYLADFYPTDIMVSRLAELEVTSALQRVAVSGKISESERDCHRDELADWLGNVSQVDIDDRPLYTAKSLLVRYDHLRTLDAIQLASALLVRASLQHTDTLFFLASDHRLLKAARAEGFEVWDPADPTSRPIPAVPVN